MVKGTDIFKEYFSEYKNQFTIIGGVACNLIMNDAGLDFRATQDFDIVIIVEALSADFGGAFWKFIRAGEYQVNSKSNGEPHFYRFSKPSKSEYPKMLEIFSRKPNFKLFDEESILTPLHISDEISSLSAILLNDEYYSFLLGGRFEIMELPVLRETHLIPFKAKAFLDLTTRKNNGESINSKDIKKHKNDVFRLYQLLSSDMEIILSSQIMNDMNDFTEAVQAEDIDLLSLGIRNISKDEILSAFTKIYGLNS